MNSEKFAGPGGADERSVSCRKPTTSHRVCPDQRFGGQTISSLKTTRHPPGITAAIRRAVCVSWCAGRVSAVAGRVLGGGGGGTDATPTGGIRGENSPPGMALDNSSISRARRFSDGAASRYGSTAVHTDAGSVVDRPLTRVPADCVAGCVACVVVGDGKLSAPGCVAGCVARAGTDGLATFLHSRPHAKAASATVVTASAFTSPRARAVPPTAATCRLVRTILRNCPSALLLRPALPANHGLFIGTPATTALDALADEFYQFRRAGRMEVLVEHRRGSAPGGCTRHRPRVIVSSVPSVLSVPLGRWHVREDRGSGCQGGAKRRPVWASALLSFACPHGRKHVFAVRMMKDMLPQTEAWHPFWRLHETCPGLSSLSARRYNSAK